MKSKRFYFVTLLLGLLWLAWAATSVLAHANLTRSTPPSGAILPESPPFILLEFTEPLDPSVSSVSLVNAEGVAVVPGPGDVDEADAHFLRLPLPPLADGAYSAIWRVRSLVDGHVTEGIIGFSVGASSPAVSLLPPLGTPDPATARPHLADTLARWWLYVSAAATIGPILFALVVWRPLPYQPGAQDGGQTDHLLRRLALGGSVMGVIGTIGFAVVQANLIGTGGFEAMVRSRNGVLLCLRLLTWLIIFWFMRPRPTNLPMTAVITRLWYGAAASGAILLLTFSLQSHNAALPGFQAIPATISSWLHLFAMCAWFGGLYPLFRLLRAPWIDIATRGRIVPAFSGLAVVSVINLILTGLFAALLHVQHLPLLLTTTYGQALSLKTILLFGLLGLGAVNLLILSPRLRQVPAQAEPWLRRTIRVEITFSLTLLGAVGVLMGVAPAWEAWQAQQRLGFTETIHQDDVRLTLRITPLQVGENEIAVDVQDRRDGAAATPAQVVLRLSAPGTSNQTEVETNAQAGGRFTTRGSYLTQRGIWEIEGIIRRRGFDDIRHTFTVVLP